MINQFRGKYYFLSNFFNHEVTYQGLTYLNNEAAFQAAKLPDSMDSQKVRFTKLPPNEAKRLGRHVKLRSDWDKYRLQVMTEVVAAKFSDPILAKKLKSTGTAKLVEGNTWNDMFWGANLTTGRGHNNLGKILMDLRSKL